MAKVPLEIFSCSDIELRYVRATIHTSTAGDITLESAEPHRIRKMTRFPKTLEKMLTLDEATAVRQAGMVTVYVTAKFEANIEVSRLFGGPLFK
jgi:hypothetical protein